MIVELNIVISLIIRKVSIRCITKYFYTIPLEKRLKFKCLTDP